VAKILITLAQVINTKTKKQTAIATLPRRQETISDVNKSYNVGIDRTNKILRTQTRVTTIKCLTNIKKWENIHA
jgi:hypothetical protein